MWSHNETKILLLLEEAESVIGSVSCQNKGLYLEMRSLRCSVPAIVRLYNVENRFSYLSFEISP